MWALDADALEARYAELAIEVDRTIGGEPRIRVDSQHASALLRRLREDETLSLIHLVDLTAIDRGTTAPARFEIVYRLDSSGRNTPVRVHAEISSDAPQPNDATQVTTDPEIDSVVTLWPVAAWLEREVFDLFGIRFRGHPELRRLLLDEGFEGSPLRKDFPRGGLAHAVSEAATLSPRSGEGAR